MACAHSPLFPNFLGLHFILPSGQILYWVWVCMPLGIVDAAYIFTKITKPIMASLRLEGKRSSIYIDDLFNSHQTEVGCAQQEVYIHNQFYKGGWVFKPEKSSGPPSQIVKYLGILINSITMSFEIPEDKFEFVITESSFLNLNKFPRQAAGSGNCNL